MRHLLLIGLFLFSLTGKAQTYFPPLTGSTWDTLAPGNLNWCQDSINSLYQYLDDAETKSFIVLKDGKIVLEKYFGTYTVDSTSSWNSAAKSLRAVLIGIAHDEGSLDIQDRTSDYIGSGWTSLSSVEENQITIRHQLTMTSGLDESNFSCVTPSCLNYVADAGTRWAYHNGPYSLLKNVLESATGDTFNGFTNTRVKNKTGMSGIWLTVLGSSFYFSNARSMARFGLMIYNNGYWDTTPVLDDPVFFNDMLNSSQSLNPSYGYLWWLNGKSSFVDTNSPPNSWPGPIAPNAPSDVVVAAGFNGQYISISPSNGMVMVRQGTSSSSSLTEFGLHDEIWKRLMNMSCSVGTPDMTESDVKIFPNPGAGQFKIEIKNAISGQKARLYSSSGKLVWSQKIDTNVSHMNVGHLSKGIYILEIGSMRQKVIIQ